MLSWVLRGEKECRGALRTKGVGGKEEAVQVRLEAGEVNVNLRAEVAVSWT